MVAKYSKNNNLETDFENHGCIDFHASYDHTSEIFVSFINEILQIQKEDILFLPFDNTMDRSLILIFGYNVGDQFREVGRILLKNNTDPISLLIRKFAKERLLKYLDHKKMPLTKLIY